MGVKVSNLTLYPTLGVQNELTARWDFGTSSTSGSGSSNPSTSSSTIKQGSTVKVKSGASYWNGVAVPSWVIADTWIVQEVSGDRVVINKNVSGTQSIMSPISASYLTVQGASGRASTTTSGKLDEVEQYQVRWDYYTGDGPWYIGSTGTVPNERKTAGITAVFSVPENALKVTVYVKPIAKNHKVNGNDTPYWNGEYVHVTYDTSNLVPDPPSISSVKIEKTQITIEATPTGSVASNRQALTDKIQFDILDYNTEQIVNTALADVKFGKAVYVTNLSEGGKYVIRARSVNVTTGKNIYSAYTDPQVIEHNIPETPKNLRVSVYEKDYLMITWDSAPHTESYEIEYAINKAFFDASDLTSNNSIAKGSTTGTSYIMRNLDGGNTYYFRIRGTSQESYSEWSEIFELAIGKKPEIPTTWSLSTTAYVGETIRLFVVHNAEDNSKPTNIRVELNINDTISYIDVEVDKNKDEVINEITLNTSSYSEGANILWRAQTKGVVDEWSDWSIQRTIKLYATPSITVTTLFTNPLKSLPLKFRSTIRPTSQHPLSYSITVNAMDSYETQDRYGNLVLVNKGDAVYSKIFILSLNDIDVEIGAGDITLQNNQFYEINVTAALDSGLKVSGTTYFGINWDVDNYEPNAEIYIDKENVVAYISPYCMTGENLSTDVVLSVFRKNYDGSMVEIMSNIQNTGNVTVTDMHTSMDIASYRIVAKNTQNGSVGYTDIDDIIVKIPGIIIQWDETNQTIPLRLTEDRMVETSFAGNILKLKYNVDTTEERTKDVSLIKYIGRNNPVSYYGTQQGEGATWNAVIPKTDRETISMLRRLSSYQGDVYVREQNGTGYKANITVSMQIRHLETTIPITLTVKRVEE